MSLDLLPQDEELAGAYLSSPSMKTLTPIVQHLLRSSEDAVPLDPEEIYDLYILEGSSISIAEIKALIDKCSLEM